MCIAVKPYGHATRKVLRIWRAISSAPPFHMTYIPAQDSSDGVAKVIYQSKDNKTSKTFDALDWLVPPPAGLTTHVPNKGESRRRRDYYGNYSNKARGLRKKAGIDDQLPALIEPGMSSKEFRQYWA